MPEQKSPEQLLYTRRQSTKVLGYSDVSSTKRLEQKGLLTPIRLSKSPSGMVFHSAAQVIALVKKLIEEAADESK